MDKHTLSVLVLEDDPLDIQVFQHVIEGYNVEATFSKTLKGARRLLDTNTYDAVFVDIRIPDGEGLELLTRCKDIPVRGVLTGLLEPKWDTAKSVGATHYIEKSMTIEMLKEVLGNYGITRRISREN
jgi:CheY-like chemotaxis protein